MSPQFSEKPGRRERHLQRMAENSLFSEEARQVSDEAISVAREQDDETIDGRRQEPAGQDVEGLEPR